MNFTSTIEPRNVDIYDLDKKFPKLAGLQNGSDYEIEPGGFAVNWSVDIETREWGIKDINWKVTDIGGDFEIVYFDANGDEKEREYVEFEPDQFRDKFKMEAEITARGMLSVDNIEIDYSDMSVEVS